MMEMAGHADHLVLFSGDGDFRRLVEAVQRRGVRVTVVSTVTTQPAMIADDLRRQADQFVDLADLEPSICRDPSQQRPPREPREPRESRGRHFRQVPEPVPFEDNDDLPVSV